MTGCTRRSFLRHSAWLGTLSSGTIGLDPTGQLAHRLLPFAHADAPRSGNKGDRMAYGLVTYLWGQHWTLEQLIANCDKANVLGVELRTTHKHGVEPNLDRQARADVAKRFADSRVKLVGLGSNERLDHPDAESLRKSVEEVKRFLQLSHDVGSSGVKVKPDRFHASIPREKTIEQIGTTLNELGAAAKDLGQQIRLEVHGQCAELATIRAILDVADHDHVAVCWNSNAQDVQGQGLRYNFELVSHRLGATCHVRELDSPDYPYEELIRLLVGVNYQGWVMLEASSSPSDPIAALAAQGRLFHEMVRAAQG